MTSLQQAAEAAHPEQPHPSSRDAAVNRGWSSVDRQLQVAFIAGAEWALEEAAQVAIKHWPANIAHAHDIAAAIRSLSTNNPTIPISGSSGSDRENTIGEAPDE